MTRRSVFFVMALVFVLWVTPVLSQSDASQIYRERAVVSFPQSIYFEMEIQATEDDIEALALIIAEDTSLETSVTFGSDEPFDVFTQSVFASYTWDIPADNPPDLFQEMTYSWQGRIGGQTIDVEGTVVYANGQVNWLQAESDDGRLSIAVDARITQPTRLVAQYESVIDLLQTNTGRSPQIRVLYHLPQEGPGCLISEDSEPVTMTIVDYQNEAVTCDTQLASDVIGQSGYQVIAVEGTFDADENLLPLLVREHYLPLWQGVSVPAWFNYGLRAFYAPVADSTDLLTSRQNIRADDVLRLNDMNVVPADESSLMRWRAQAHGLVVYLADQQGVDVVFELARDVANYDDFEAAFESLTGDTLDALVPRWETWIFSDAATLAYGYAPYIDITPTLTATPTLTNTSPPPTVTPTPTETPDVTNTPRPTQTPIPPTATVTPLPAESFVVRPTVVATSTPANVGIPMVDMLPGLSNTQLAILCGGVFLALLFLAIALLSRQQSSSS